jgi:uncharacterized protein YigE (DUF2233 family)
MFARSLLLILPVLLAQPARAVDCQRREFKDAAFVACRVDTGKEKLSLHHADDRGVVYDRIPVLRVALAKRGQKLAFAMNAGMFHPDMKPVGLLVIAGRQIAPINRASGSGNFYMQPNGVFLVDAQGPRVLATHEYRNLEPVLATQSGPMLLAHGVIPDIAAFRPGSRSRYRRNGVCVPEPGIVAFVISDDAVTLREFALFFREAIGCRDALYLDGAISSLYWPALARDDQHARLGPIFAVIE